MQGQGQSTGQYSSAPMDITDYRRQMGGPRGLSRPVRNIIRSYSRTPRKIPKMGWSGRSHRRRMFKGSQMNGKYGAGGNIIAPTLVKEPLVKYTRPRIDTSAALKTFSFNRCDYWSSTLGLQRVVSYPVMDYTMTTAMGAADTAVDSSSEQFTVMGARQGLEIMNTSNNTLSLKVYFLEALQDGAALPEDLYTTALGDAGFTADNTLATYIEPTKLPRFNRVYKTVKIEAAVLGSGSMAQFESNWRPKKNVSLSNYSVTNFVTGNITRYAMIVWHGAPCKATTTTPIGDGSTIGPSQIALLHYGEVNYKSNLSNARLGYQTKRQVQVTTASAPVIMREDADTSANYATA